MPSDPYDIETIERYLTFQMGGSERAGFEARLEQDERLRQEVQGYQPIMDGLLALRCEGFREQLNSWEAEWAKAGADETELIEWYLNGALTGDARRRIEERIKEDDAFAREVAAYRQVHQGFEASRTEAFRQRMEQWEVEKSEKAKLPVAARRSLWPRIAAAAAILLLLAFSFNWYVQSAFSSEAIAESYYRPPLEDGTMGERTDAQEAVNQAYQKAHRLFQQGDFPAAYQAFDSLLAQLPNASIDNLSRTNYREHCEWNRLLAAVRLSPPPLDVRSEARRIASTDGHEFQEAAKEILRQLESPWYRWAN